MKILIVSHYYHPYVSGMTVYAKNLAEGLTKKGHKVSVITTRYEKYLKSNEIVNKVNVIRVPIAFKFNRGAFSPSFVSQFAKIVNDFDVVNIHAPIFEAGSLADIAKNKGKKVVVTYHCDLDMKGVASKIIERLYYSSVKKALEYADSIVVNTMDYMKNSKVKEFSNKAVGIIPPIEANKFRYERGFKKKYSIPEKSEIIGFLGRITREKGVEYLALAMPEILEKRNAILVVAGEGEKVAGGKKESLKFHVMKISKKLGIEDRIIFTGFLDEKDKNKFYSACSAFVVPSTGSLESFNYTQVEAMLCGTPVIVTNLPGVRVMVTKIKGGLIVPIKNSKAIADAAIKILSNRKKYVVERKKLLKIFGIERSVNPYEKLFR